MNLSPLDLMRNDCGAHLIQILDEFEIPYSCVQFEITETAATEYTAGLIGWWKSFHRQVSACAWMISAPATRI